VPDITDTQVVRWSNERARTLADLLTRTSYVLSGFIADYAAQGIAAKITAAGAANNVGDGAATDGRPFVTGTQLTNLRAAALQVQTAIDTTLVSGVGTSVKAIADAIQVNGAPK
jgi:hypothetical protein